MLTMKPGLRVYYHSEGSDPDDQSDTGLVTIDGRAVIWDAHDPCPRCPKAGPRRCSMRDIDEVAPDGRLLTVDGWAIPLGVDARAVVLARAVEQ